MNKYCCIDYIIFSGGSRLRAKGVGEGRGGGFVLLALSAFLPSVISFLPKIGGGGGGGEGSSKESLR